MLESISSLRSLKRDSILAFSLVATGWKLNLVPLLGGPAGAQTMIAGAAAVQKSESPVAMLGYSYTVAFGHILLTTWGTVIVAFMA